MTWLRLALLCACCCLLVGLAGCGGLGSSVDEERLAQNQSYDWDTNATVTYNVTGDRYHAVVNVTGEEPIPVYRHSEVEGRQPVPIAALKFRYPNGTVVGADAVGVVEKSERLLLDPPAQRGQIAYSAPNPGKRFGASAGVSGSYEVILPRQIRVRAFLFGSVSPGGYERTLDAETGRVHLRWAELSETSIQVNYYLARDFDIFVALVAVGAAVAVIGVLYYRRQLHRLRVRREEMGIDVESED
jgi:hypothetical protein